MDHLFQLHGNVQSLKKDVEHLHADIMEMKAKQDEMLEAIHALELRKVPMAFGAGSGAAVVALIEFLKQTFGPHA